MKDSMFRTIIKTIFFKVLTTGATVLYTGMGIGKAIALHLILMGIYLLYERVWVNIKWGKKNVAEEVKNQPLKYAIN
jgi:uncharacterized membrane protein